MLVISPQLLKILTLFPSPEQNFLTHIFPSYFSGMGVHLFQFKYLYKCGTKVETQKVQKACILELIPIPFAPFAYLNTTNVPKCSVFVQI